MVTYFLSDDEVRAYLRDFLSRLERLDPLPTTWCPVTLSGWNLLREMLPLMEKDHPELAKTVTVVRVGINDETKTVKFDTDHPQKHICGKPVLLFDSSMHTGGTMCRVVGEALKLGASSVATYSLVIKIGSNFIPTFWGVIIDDTDRIFFMLDKIPNGRLDSGPERTKDGQPRKIQTVFIRRLCEEHLKAPQLQSKVRSLDRVTWGDRHFDMQAGGHKECTYVLQTGKEIAGYLSLHFSDPGSMFVTEIAVDHSLTGKGYGAVLMRFADTLARQSNCEWVRLNAIENKITFYKGFGYKLIPGRDKISLDEEVYWPMERKVVSLSFKTD
jgi:GNAT superfamily N-acetyltransferase